MYEFQEDDIERMAALERKKHARKTPHRPKSREDGEGTLYLVSRKLQDGTERTYYRAAKGLRLPSGQHKRVVAQAATAAEAVEKRDAKLLKLKVAWGLEPPEALPPEPGLAYRTVGDCLSEWLAERRTEDLTQNTIHMYDARIRNHLLPAFGETPVRLLNYGELKVFFAETLPAKGLGTDSIRQTFITLKSALDYYIRDGKLSVHPMTGLKPPAKKRKTVEDAKAIRRASKFLGKYLMAEARKTDQEARWFLGMLGMRQGEVLGMTDDCLDGARPKERGRRVVIKQQLQRVSAAHGCGVNLSTGKEHCGRQSSNCPKRIGKTGFVLQKTKTESGYREIVIPEDAWQMLVAHRKRQQEKRKLVSFHPESGEGLDRLLFTREDGKPVYAQRDREAVDGLISSIKNLPVGLTVHTLRHIATTSLIDGKANRDDLIAMMGWSPKNADAQIATYSSADVALRASGTSTGYVESFFRSAD